LAQKARQDIEKRNLFLGLRKGGLEPGSECVCISLDGAVCVGKVVCLGEVAPFRAKLLASPICRLLDVQKTVEAP